MSFLDFVQYHSLLQSENLISPRTLDEEGIVNMDLLVEIEDLIGPFISWPSTYRILMQSRHLNWSKRNILVSFLLFNGLYPPKILEWFRSQGCIRNKAASLHVTALITAFKIHKLDKYKTFILHTGKLG